MPGRVAQEITINLVFATVKDRTISEARYALENLSPALYYEHEPDVLVQPNDVADGSLTRSTVPALGSITYAIERYT